MKIKIQVTQQDIHLGLRGSKCDCPIAIAACRAFGKQMIVSNTAVYADEGNETYMLPKEATIFIDLFDSQHDVKPIEFEVERIQGSYQR